MLNRNLDVKEIGQKVMMWCKFSVRDKLLQKIAAKITEKKLLFA